MGQPQTHLNPRPAAGSVTHVSARGATRLEKAWYRFSPLECIAIQLEICGISRIECVKSRDWPAHGSTE